MTGPVLAAGIASLALLAAGPAPGSGAAPVRDCIRVASGADTQYYPADDHTIAIRSQRRWYKLTVSPSSMLNEPGSFFINEIRGTSTLCSPLDFDLSVATTPPGGFRQRLIAQSFESITADEGEALRKRSRR